MAKEKTIDEYEYDNPAIINVKDTGTALCMFDKLTRIAEGRRIFPFDQSENVIYLHRGYYSDYNLQIGDTCFMIPPEFIMVSSEATSQSIVTLRQENTIKERSGFHKRTILIDLVFNGLDQINGFPVVSPEEGKTYYVDGLRQLLAQFKCTPFLPISNELINGVYGIFTVVLQSITMSTVSGFPNMMTAQITLQEVDMFPYIEMPSFCFEQMIDWDLFRYYYQSFLTETHEYKKLQSLPSNKERNHFKLSILDESVFYSDEATEYNLLELVCDQKIVKQGSDSTNYTLYLDSTESDCIISGFQCGYANLLTNIQLSDCSCPTVQFMGGMDTIYNISFETTDYSVVQALEHCRIVNDNLTRNNGKFHSLGFVKLESELVAFTGSLFVMIESVTTNTVPGFPNLYNVTINCVSYDIAQSKREELHGFRPFECNESDCVNNSFEPNHVHGDGDKDQTIEQSMKGLETKIKQDNYAEWKLRTEMEVYPDLHLPKYSEVNNFIKQCNSFRKSHGLDKLPYSEYPVRPICMLHGSNPNNNITIEKDSDGIIDGASVNASTLEYDIYVDPDFYVFYPWSYKSFEATETTDGLWYDSYKNKTRDSVTKTVTREQYPLTQGATDAYSGSGASSSSLVEEFIAVCESQIGCTYQMTNKADGRLKDSNGRNILDCSGLVTYALRQIGAMSQSDPRLTVESIATGKNGKIFEEVPWSEKKRGDCLVKYGNGSHHVVVYKGGDSIIHASSGQGKVVNGKQYFTSNERVFRPLIFSTPSTESSVTEVVGTGNEAVWNALKSYGLSDYACAGIMGNMVAESGINPYNVQGSWKQSDPDSYNKNYVAKVDNGTISRYDFVNNGPGGGGFGLVQFTWHTYKAELYDLAKSQGKSVADIGVQITVFINQIKANGVFDQLNNATSVRDASNIMLLKYERPADQSVGVQNKRASNSQSIYSQYAGSGSQGGESNGTLTSGPVLTTSEFESICRIVMAETEGLNSTDAQTAITQLIYDRLHSKRFGGLGNILNDREQFAAPATEEIPENVKTVVTDVFCNGKKYWSDWTAMTFLTPDSNISSYKINDEAYDRISPDVSIFSFWGINEPGSDIQYTISDSTGTGDASTNNRVFTSNVTYEAITVDVDAFAEPVLVETDAIMYDENDWKFWMNGERKSNAKECLNHSRRIFGSSFVDEAQYSSRGRLVRAFPAYLFCILDDQCQWYDGRKLWSNYYIHKAVIDIAVHETNDMPTSTATITVSNSYGNLSKTQGGLGSYSVTEDLNWFQQAWYNLTGLVWDLGSPNLTDKMIKLHQVIYSHARLREGARVHLRMGYGSDPLSLAPMINGHISDVTIGKQLNIIVTSDGSELIQHITSANEKDTNNGWFGLFGLGEVQEASNIIAHIMCKRQSWANVIVGSWFEGSKYSIEHFGLYFNQSVMKAIAGLAMGAGVGFLGGLAAGAAAGSVVPGAGTLLGAGIGAALGLIGGIVWSDTVNISDLWNEYQEQYDIMKNVYKASYEREHYIYSDFAGYDKEPNIVFNQYNMTPWDVFQMCAQTAPEYIVKPSMHQFDSRLYFGLPFWMEKYRYDYLNGHVYEECKSASQMHMIDSLTNIIDNQIRVTNRYSNTNIKVMYTRGKTPTSTQTIHSDDTIDYSKQKTGIIDSSITQDALGPDVVYEWLGYNIGEESARRLGISNLLYGWQQQYQGQIICMGMPGIKAHDYFMIYDTYTNIYGLALVREVVHSFGVNTGFTTSVTPGMIGFSTDNQSGMVEVCKNYLNLLNHFSSFLYTRHELKNNYEKNLNLFSEMKVLEAKARAAINWNTGLRIAGGIPETALSLGGYVVVWKRGVPFTKVNGLKKTMTETITNLRNVEKLKDAGNAFVNMVKTTFAAEKAKDGIMLARGAKNITAGIKAIQAGTTAAAGTIVPGVGAIVAFAIWTIVDIMIGEFIQWLSNKNVCCLLPLWWDNSTFVSGVKDGKKILLCNGNSDGAEDTEPGLLDRIFNKASDSDMHEGEITNPSEDNED